MKKIIVIPIYKKELSNTEECSLRQCIKVLGSHEICLVTYEELDKTCYSRIFKDFGKNALFEYFDKCYFNDIAGYNTLCMSECFYERFAQYDYMLIYQLDAWVFSDEFSFWCEQDYDYIGAPWSTPVVFHGVEKWVGNGGFCLRRISKFLDIFRNQNARAFSIATLWKEVELIHIETFCTFVLKVLGYRNSYYYLLNYFKQYGTPEDCFWSVGLSNTLKKLNVPEKEIARAFSFELDPALQYELNNRRLPFGCHAFEKYSYDSFWKSFIYLDNSKNG